ARLEREIGGHIAEMLVLEIVGVRQYKLDQVEAVGLRAFGGDGASPDPVRQRILEPARLGDLVRLASPEGETEEVVPNDGDVMHGGLDRVPDPFEAVPAAEFKDSRDAAFGVGAVLEELAHARLAVGVLDRGGPTDGQTDAGHRRAIRGDPPA